MTLCVADAASHDCIAYLGHAARVAHEANAALLQQIDTQQKRIHQLEQRVAKLQSVEHTLGRTQDAVQRLEDAVVSIKADIKLLRK